MFNARNNPRSSVTQLWQGTAVVVVKPSVCLFTQNTQRFASELQPPPPSFVATAASCRPDPQSKLCSEDEDGESFLSRETRSERSMFSDTKITARGVSAFITFYTNVRIIHKLWSARNTNVLYQKTWFEVKLKQSLVQSLQSEASQSNIQHTEV